MVLLRATLDHLPPTVMGRSEAFAKHLTASQPSFRVAAGHTGAVLAQRYPSRLLATLGQFSQAREPGRTSSWPSSHAGSQTYASTRRFSYFHCGGLLPERKPPYRNHTGK